MEPRCGYVPTARELITDLATDHAMGLIHAQQDLPALSRIVSMLEQRIQELEQEKVEITSCTEAGP